MKSTLSAAILQAQIRQYLPRLKPTTKHHTYTKTNAWHYVSVIPDSALYCLINWQIAFRGVFCIRAYARTFLYKRNVHRSLSFSIVTSIAGAVNIIFICKFTIYGSFISPVSFSFFPFLFSYDWCAGVIAAHNFTPYSLLYSIKCKYVFNGVF